MSTDHRAQVAELMADYRRSRERLAETHHDLSSIAETARSEDGSVQVVVGPQGVLREVVLSGDVYERQRPAQLAATIVQLTAAAAQAASRRAADVLAEVLPAGTDPELLLGGRADGASDSAPRNESRRIDDNVDDDDDDFSDASWLRQGPAERKW
ncbi:YbaB/EbfC family nucleoid-associated protein [Saccharopolyspora sp. ASAGF58]|uniref:YbaB/EbfC family nucleoid-associated protein n=1 Tax=Saccharopolyspora sp. ASAGF58 TaxID=2719023 RepID=UPI00143FBB39|nr:YbaB/EbfC family nucleoid-associated protein [Saccharopolyspora sp. ASAGF58]QIZ34588.1 YbaB/EbfC family DNA-binding protein [Saccharopolyspora sp. ASAGF58]